MDKSAILSTHRVFDTMHVFVEFKNADDVTLLKEIYQKHGKSVKKLDWSNWSSYA
jgi:uncharacterized protein YifE (UPF0438 family)